MGPIKRSLLVITAALFCQTPSQCQGFRVDPFGLDGKGGYWTKWDSVQQKLLLYRDTDDAAVPGARIFARDGSSIPVYPVRDLDQARYVDVWDVAATPQGGIVLSVIVGYAPRKVKPAKLKSFLLTYDEVGGLKKVWEMDPYHHHLLAADREGNVFALGDSNLKEPYPLLVKYSHTGSVLAEFLPSSTFPEGEKVIANGAATGDSRMFIAGDHLYVWLARPQELLGFSLRGELVTRTSFAQAFSGLATETGKARARVKLLTATEDGRVFAEIQLWPSQASDSVRSVVVRLSPDGSRATLLPVPLDPAWLLGNTAAGKLVFLQPESEGRAGSIVIW
jgi:hypothetical protein